MSPRHGTPSAPPGTAARVPARAGAVELLAKHTDHLSLNDEYELDAVDVDALLLTPQLDDDVRGEIENVLRKTSEQEMPFDLIVD